LVGTAVSIQRCIECGGRLVYNGEVACEDCGLVHPTFNYGVRTTEYILHKYSGEMLGGRRTREPKCIVCLERIPNRRYRYCPKHAYEASAIKRKRFNKTIRCTECGRIRKRAVKNVCWSCYKKRRNGGV
jgi:uncharacterized Zn finger protein